MVGSMVRPTRQHISQLKSIFAALVLWFAGHLALADDSRIVPGKQIGKAVLGAQRQQMHEAYGKPDETVRLDSGIVREDWLTKNFAPKAYLEDGRYFKHDFLTAYFREDLVIQIEVSSATFKTPEGRSTASGAQKFQQQYPGYKRIHPPHFQNLHPGGFPATKHYVTYEDAMADGIAWRFGAWGNLAPEPDASRLEIVIVHRPGEPVFVDPDGGGRLVWKRRPYQLLENHPK
jgi:hypothetical protein